MSTAKFSRFSVRLSPQMATSKRGVGSPGRGMLPGGSSGGMAQAGAQAQSAIPTWQRVRGRGQAFTSCISFHIPRQA
jgi:hypothetical protein